MTHRVVFDHGTFAHEQRGALDGAVVLLQHGFPDAPGTFFPLMDRLARAGLCCVAPYLRGYAPSTTEAPFHVERLGADLVDLSRSLSPEASVVLIGHDWGAVAAYEAMRQAPELFPTASPRQSWSS